MSDHRRSFRKTIFAAVALAVVTGAVAAASGSGAVRASGGSRVAFVAGAVVALFATLALALVATGGAISLHRDSCEERGVPYARRMPRERPFGGLAALLRALGKLVPRQAGALGLLPGELVEVRSLQEILATLDDDGTLNGLPFMPEMVAACGQRFRVFRRIDKINDWVRHSGLRRMHDTVLLEQFRCDGSAHGGCQAHCHVQWREAWLKRADSKSSANAGTPAVEAGRGSPDLYRLTRRVVSEDSLPRYVCQVTQLAAGAPALAWSDPRHYVRDVVSGNIRLVPSITGVSIAMFNWAQRLRGGAAYPLLPLPQSKTTPRDDLGLQPGERVRVKSKSDITATLNARSRNRGLWFDIEMLRFCGGEYRVLARVDRLIEESTGKMMESSTPSIILDGVTASGEYLGFCPQNESIFWREVWLTRV